MFFVRKLFSIVHHKENVVESFVQYITQYGTVYLMVTFLSFLNIIIPMSGSATTTPLILTLTGNPQYAIALASWILMLNTGMGAFIFKSHIRKEYVWKLLPASLVGVVLGAVLLLNLPNWLVTLVLFGFSARFLFQIIRRYVATKKEERKNAPNTVLGAVATFLSSFLQGTGLSGGGMRFNYLYAEGLKIEEVRGTGNLLNFLVFGVASLVRLGDNQISLPDMVGWSLIFIPILLTANYLGRKVLLQLPDKVKDGVVILTMVYIVGDLSIKGIQML